VRRVGIHHPVLDRGRGRVKRHGAEGVGQRLLVPACAELEVHQLADVEHCSRLKVKSGDDRVFVGRRGGGDELRGHDRGRPWCHLASPFVLFKILVQICKVISCV
jgi:hypothetical protein